MNINNFDELINFSANISQFIDLGFNLKQITNDELMKMLVYQNKEYLKKIINLLKGESSMHDYEDKCKCFEKIIHRANDLLKDSYKYYLLAMECESEEDKKSLMETSRVLKEQFMKQHELIGNKFKEQ